MELLDFSCHTCTAHNKKTRGCTEDAPEPWSEFDGEPMRTCPLRLSLNEPRFVGELFWHFRNYKAGILPDDGGLNSQAAVFVEGVKIIGDALNSAEADKAERDKKRQKRGGPLAQPARKSPRRR